MKLPARAILSGIAALGIASAAQAATSTFVGSVQGTAEVGDWRTVSTPKTFDIDSSNRYGDSIGAVIWGLGSAGETGANSTTLGWHYVGDSGQFGGNAGYVTVDNLTATAKTAAGIGGIGNPGTFTFQMTGTAADYAGKVVRVGMMSDVLTSGEAALDSSKTFRVTGPGGADSGVIARSAGDHTADMYFFDLTGVNPGDQFTITATTGTSQSGYIGPVSWDIAAVPEPTSLAMLGIVGIGLVGRRQRRS